MKIDRVLDSKIAAFAICTIFVVLGALYYYELQCQYAPEGENLTTITTIYSYLTLGTSYHINELLYTACAFLSTIIGGMSYFSIRLHFTLLYMILLGITVFLCLSPKTGNGTNLYRLPLAALFCVFMYPAADNPQIFQWPEGADLIYEWPFHYHYTARIYALVCLSLLLLLMRTKGKNKRIIYGVFLAAVCLYAAKTTGFDLIFFILFPISGIIVGFLHFLQTDKLRKYAVACISIGMVSIFLSRVLPTGIKASLWTKERADVYGSIRGGTNWISVDVLGEYLLNYVKLNCMLFNIQLPGSPVISLYTVVDMLKIAVLSVGYIILFHVIKCSFAEKSELYHYDYIDEILAWSYLLLSFIAIFTEFGSMTFGKFRYFPALTTVMTILICRNIEIFPQIVGLKMLKEIKYKKILLCTYALALCLCSAEKVWAYSAPNGYDPELMAMVEYIEGTGYGHVVAGHWLWPRVSVLSGGEVMAYETERDIESVYGDDAKIAYIITRNDNYSDGLTGTLYEHCNTYEEICEYYSEPSDVIRYERLQLLVFKDGIKIKE